MYSVRQLELTAVKKKRVIQTDCLYSGLFAKLLMIRKKCL